MLAVKDGALGKLGPGHSLAWLHRPCAPPRQWPVAGAPGPRGVFAAAAVMWAFGGASGQALRRPLPSGVLHARAPTWRPNSAACGHVGVRAGTKAPRILQRGASNTPSHFP